MNVHQDGVPPLWEKDTRTAGGAMRNSMLAALKPYAPSALFGWLTPSVFVAFNVKATPELLARHAPEIVEPVKMMRAPANIAGWMETPLDLVGQIPFEGEMWEGGFTVSPTWELHGVLKGLSYISRDQGWQQKGVKPVLYGAFTPQSDGGTRVSIIAQLRHETRFFAFIFAFAFSVILFAAIAGMMSPDPNGLVWGQIPPQNMQYAIVLGSFLLLLLFWNQWMRFHRMVEMSVQQIESFMRNVE